jgi:hypothetical protein
LRQEALIWPASRDFRSLIEAFLTDVCFRPDAVYASISTLGSLLAGKQKCSDRPSGLGVLFGVVADL